MLWVVDRLHLCFDYHFESNSLSFFSFLYKMLFILFIYLFMKLTHIQVFKKRTYEARIKCFCLQVDTLFFLLMFCMFRYSYNKIYTN